MKRVIGYAALAFVVIFAVLFTYFWFSQAKMAQRSTEEFLAKLNAEQKFITYESIHTSGFPFKVSVDIVNPTFTGRIDELFKPLQAALPVAPDGSDQAALKDALTHLPEWHENWALKGTLSLTVDMWANTFTFKQSGHFEGTSDIAGKVKMSVMGEMEGANECRLEVSRGALLNGELWDFSRLQHMTPEEVSKNFRGFNCRTSAYKLVDKNTKQTLMSADKGSFGLDLKPTGDQLAAKLYMHIKDAEVSPAMDTYLTEYKKLNLFGQSSFANFNWSQYGKQNVDFEASYFGPKDPTTIGQTMAFSMKVDKLQMSNALMNSNNNFLLANAPKDGKADIQITLNSSSTMTDAYNQLASKVLDDTVDQIMDPNNRDFVELRGELKGMTAEELKVEGHKLLPNYKEWGELKLELDAHYIGAANADQSISLKNVEIGIAPYGIKAFGEGKQATNQMTPAGTWQIECRNCAHMVDSLGTWFMDLQTLLQRTNAEKQAQGFNITAAHIAAVKGFLGALVPDASKADYVYKIITDGGMGITINGKNLQQVLQLYSEHMAPVLNPTPAAAAPVPAAPKPAPKKK